MIGKSLSDWTVLVKHTVLEGRAFILLLGPTNNQEQEKERTQLVEILHISSLKNKQIL